MADDVDLLSFNEARQVISEVTAAEANTTNGLLLAAAVTGASKALARRCGPIVQQTYTDEAHDGGVGYIWLRHWPVTTITTITDDGTSLVEQSNGTEPAAGYYPDRYSQDSAAYSGKVRRLSSGSPYLFEGGVGQVLVTYTAGRFATTGAVTEDFKHAARITLENWWQQFREGTAEVGDYEVPYSTFPRFAVPQAAVQLLGDEVHERDDGSDVQVG